MEEQVGPVLIFPHEHIKITTKYRTIAEKNSKTAEQNCYN